MNAPTRRERNRAEKRQRILDAALTVFGAEGYGAATMDAIAAAAGLTKPTLYQYFSTKEALFQEMMRAPRDAMLTAFEPGAAEDHVERLWRFAWDYAGTVMRPEFLALARLVIGEAQRFPEIGRAYQASGPDLVLEGLARFMAEEGRAGRLILDEPELAAEDFWGLILSAPRNRALHVPDETPTPETLGRFVANGMRVFLRAYAARPQDDLRRLEALIAAAPLGPRAAPQPLR